MPHLAVLALQKILTAWVDKKKAIQSEGQRAHQQNIMGFFAQADEHQIQLSNLIVEKRRVAVEKEKENLEGDSLQRDVSNLNAKCAELAAEVKNTHEVQHEQAAILDAKKSEIARLTEINTTIVGELQKSLGFYRKFGLNFERLDDRQLKLTFTLVDPRDHARPFAFFLLINSRDQYEVEGCSPPVAALPVLLATLNATNDFSAFVISMRQQFKMMV